MRAIDADALIKKLKNHHDFFVNAHGGFSNLPEKEKARVDEMTQCIADVQNAQTLTFDDLRPNGRWVNNKDDYSECDQCGYMPQYDPMIDDIYCSPFCPSCGADMRGGGEDG